MTVRTGQRLDQIGKVPAGVGSDLQNGVAGLQSKCDHGLRRAERHDRRGGDDRQADVGVGASMLSSAMRESSLALERRGHRDPNTLGSA
jgi:hypothetical protein